MINNEKKWRYWCLRNDGDDKTCPRTFIEAITSKLEEVTIFEYCKKYHQIGK